MSDHVSRITKFTGSFLHVYGLTISQKQRQLFESIIIGLEISFSTLIFSFKYIHRYLNKLLLTIKFNQITSNESFSLLIVALLTASKYLHDNSQPNIVWALKSGIDINELNHAEAHFLQVIRFDIQISEKEYSKWLQELIAFVALKERIQLETRQLYLSRRSSSSSSSLTRSSTTCSNESLVSTPTSTSTLTSRKRSFSSLLETQIPSTNPPTLSLPPLSSLENPPLKKPSFLMIA